MFPSWDPQKLLMKCAKPRTKINFSRHHQFRMTNWRWMICSRRSGTWRARAATQAPRRSYPRAEVSSGYWCITTPYFSQTMIEYIICESRSWLVPLEMIHDLFDHLPIAVGVTVSFAAWTVVPYPRKRMNVGLPINQRGQKHHDTL